MIKFDEKIKKINFKKVAIGYLIVTIIAVILSLSFLGFEFKDKLIFAYDYAKVSHKIEHGRQSADSVKNDLTALAAKSSDLVDILVLSADNRILFSAKNSEFSKNNPFVLEVSDTGRENRYLTQSSNPDVYFKLVGHEHVYLSKDMISKEHDIESEYNDEYFYLNNFNSKKVYMLSYVVDKVSGDKIYFISDIKPVANGELYVKIVSALATLFFMVYWVLVALWVYADAEKSKLNKAIWGIISLFTNLAGLSVYLIYKQNNQTCFKCGAVQDRSNIYCTSCGTKISETCDACNSVIGPQDAFCKNCGAKLIPAEKSEK